MARTKKDPLDRDPIRPMFDVKDYVVSSLQLRALRIRKDNDETSERDRLIVYQVLGARLVQNRERNEAVWEYQLRASCAELGTMPTPVMLLEFELAFAPEEEEGIYAQQD